MSRPLAIALIVGLPAALVVLYAVARRDPRFVPSRLHRVVDPIALGLLLVVAVTIAVFAVADMN